MLKGPFPKAEHYRLNMFKKVTHSGAFEMPLCFHKATESLWQSSSISHHPPHSHMELKEAVQCGDQCEVGVDANLHKTLFKRCNQSEVNASAGKMCK